MKNKKKKLPIIIFIVMCLFIFLGCYFIKFSQNVNKEVFVNYNENSNIDYKVYLKENKFFEDKYLEKNRTYIASLIDYILIDFDYSFNVSEKVKGNYSYYIKGTVSANKNNSNDYYWSKDYILTEKTTKKYEDTNEINIKGETKINYQEYNNLLNNFKSQYGVTMDGLLKVSLVIENYIESDLTDHKIEKDSNVELNIPLTSLTIEVPIETNDLSNNGVLVSKVVQENILYYSVFKYLGYSLLGISVFLLALLITIIITKIKYGNKYNNKLKKILKTYDSIIVNVKTIPDIDTLNVITVTSFEELIDAHSEVRKPINYIAQKGHSIFILINDGMAWRYDLVKETSKNRKY